MNHKVHLETQKPLIAKAILSKKSNARGITILTSIYRAIAIMAWYWNKNGYEDQWDRM
jgi:hypothetical protein